MAVAVQYLAGRYRLIERLGAGGMSVVWRAYDEVLGRPVAVKVLAPRLAADPAARARIRAEAQAAARLNHPHITDVYDYGESIADGGTTVPFVVMELVDGASLDSRMRAGPVPWRFAVEVCAQVAGALAAIHARGLVHRDIKPANIMLTAGGCKVVDFGISAVAGDSERDGQVLGTPAYLAPERLDGGPADAASDVYGLGLVLYKALTGELPWDAQTTTQMLTAHRYAEPDPLPPVDGLPEAVVTLGNRCLAKDPRSRPRADEIVRVLTEAADAPAMAPTRRLLVPLPVLLRRPSWRIRAAGLAAVLAAAALVLTTVSGPERAGPPSGGAGADTPGAAPGCQVRYTTRSTASGPPEVDLVVVNTGNRPFSEWTLTVAYPGDPGTIALEGAEPLAPGGTAMFTLTAELGAGSALPTMFELAGHACTGLVAGVAEQPPAQQAGPAGDDDDAGGAGDDGGGTRGKGKGKGKSKKGGGH